MSAKLQGAEPELLEPSEAPGSEAQRARCSTLEASLRGWVMIWFRNTVLLSILPAPLFINPWVR